MRDSHIALRAGPDFRTVHGDDIEGDKDVGVYSEVEVESLQVERRIRQRRSQIYKRFPTASEAFGHQG